MPCTIPSIAPPHPPIHGADRPGPILAIDACGAVADGRLCTAAIQAAIDRVGAAGGGTVVVPAGTWRTGALRLVTGLTLRLDDGAVLLGSEDWRDYGSGAWREAILTGIGVDGVRILGPGVIDGADCFNPAGEGGARGPHGIWLDRCRDVVIRDVTLRNIGNWGFAVWSCSDLTFERLRVRGGHDGIDLQNCRRVAIAACDFEIGDDCLAGPGSSDIAITGTAFNSACNAIRLSCERMLIRGCTFAGPGRYEHRFHGGRRNTIAAIVHFSPPERGYRGGTPHSDQWLVEDCTVSDVDALFEYDHGHAWQDGRSFGSIVFRRVACAGFCTPVIAWGSMRGVGGYRRECRLHFEDCLLEPRPGCEDVGFFDLRRHGLLALRRVTLRGNGASRPIRTLDGGPVEVEDLRIEVRAAVPAATPEEALRGASAFVHATPPLPDDGGAPPLAGFPRLAAAREVGTVRDGRVRGRIYHLGDAEALLLWAVAPTPVELRGRIAAAERAGGAPLAPVPAPADASPDRGARLALTLDREPLLVVGAGLEVAAG